MSREATASEILWDVEDEHFDEAEFLIGLWRRALEMPHYDLRDLARGPERRAVAHLDALAVGGPTVAERLLWPALQDAKAAPFRSAAALAALVWSGDPARAFAALDREPNEQRVAATRAALALCPRADLDVRLAERLAQASAREQVYLLNALAARGADPGAAAGVALRSSDAALVRGAAEGIVRADPGMHEAGLATALRSTDSAVRRAALSTGLVWGLGSAWEAVTRVAASPADEPEALRWLAQLGDERHWSLLAAALERPETRAAAIWALGFSGRRAAIESCLPLLEHEKLGALAAEAIAAIAGIARDDAKLWKAAPSEPEDEVAAANESLPPLADDDLGADLVPGEADRLPAPDPAAFRAWWEGHEGEFRTGERYLGGRPMEHAGVVEALRASPLRRRHALAWELAVRTRGAQHVPTRASAARQRDVIDRLPSLPRLAFRDAYDRLP